MPYYIKGRDDEGLFVGECLGLGFFQIDCGVDCSPDEKPVEFSSRKEAEEYLNSWVGGKSDCSVVYLEKC